MQVKKQEDLDDRTRTLYKKAVDSSRKRNFDYAIGMFQEVLKAEPYFYEARRQLRNIAIDKVGGKLGGLKAKMIGVKFSMTMMKIPNLIKEGQYLQAIEQLEEVLAADPNHAKALLSLAECAQAVNMPYVAIDTLELYLTENPKDSSVAETLVNLYLENNKASTAISFLKKLMKDVPSDGTLTRLLKNSEARNAMDKSSWDDEKKGQEEAVADEGESTLSEVDAVRAGGAHQAASQGDLLAELEDPNCPPDVYKKYARQLIKEKKYEEALDVLRRAVALLAEKDVDVTLMRLMYQAKEEMIEDGIQAWEAELPRLGDEPSEARDEALGMIEKLKQRKEDFLLEKAREQASVYSREPKFQIDLGRRLFARGLYKESFEPLHVASHNNRFAKEALYMRGIGHYHEGEMEVALRDLKNALEKHSEEDAVFCEILFCLAASADAQGNTDLATETRTKLETLSPGFTLG